MVFKRLFLIPSWIIMLGAATNASAQPASGPGMAGGQGYGMMGQAGHGMMYGAWNINDYLAALKSQMSITPNQDTAWNDYADTLKDASGQMQALHQNMFAAMGTAPWPERRALMDQMLQSREESFQSVRRAADQLMAVLSPAQRQQARLTLPGGGSETNQMPAP